MTQMTDIMLEPATIPTAVLIIAVINIAIFIYNTLPPASFPRGPFGLPGFGNTFQIDKAFAFLTFSKWAEKYGKDTPLGLKKGSRNVIVLSSRRLVLELLERRGSKYNDRPYDYITREWVQKEDLKFAVHQDSSPWLVRWRREFTHHFGPAAIAKYQPVYEAETARFLVKLMENPGARRAELQNILVNWLMSVPCIGVCGQRPEDLGDFGFDMNHFRKCSVDYGALMRPQLYDIFPILKHVPEVFGMAPWKTKARAVRAGMFECANKFLSAAKSQRDALDSGKPIAWESMMAAMLRQQKHDPGSMFTSTEIANTACHVLQAGSGSSTAYFSMALMILAQRQEIQTKLREEVLQVSNGMAPKATDVKKMSYMDAFWNEVHRWRSVTPNAFPHATSQDDVYEGRRIPKGTTVLVNAWHIHHSEEDYENPDEFIPERYLQHPLGMRLDKSDNDSTSITTTPRVIFSFGAGRRICPGMQAAKETLLLGLAKLLWAFEVNPPESGEPIDLSIESGFIYDIFFLRPKTFDVVLKLRSERSKDDIMFHYSQRYEDEARIMGWQDGL